MSILKFDKPMMETAYVWSKQSYCKRNQVGCVLSKDGRIISIGYNGTVKYSSNDCEDVTEELCEECNGEGYFETPGVMSVDCPKCNGTGRKLVSKNTVVHAEANALMFAAKNGIKTEDCSLYVTMSPCIECSKLIIQSGIKEVIYDIEYRDKSGIEFLNKFGITVRKMELK